MPTLEATLHRPRHVPPAARADTRTVSADTRADFGRLIQEHQDRLYNSMFYLLRNHDDAADVVQEAFLQAFSAFDTFRHRSSFYTWLYRIALNLAIGSRRRRRRALSLDEVRERLGEEPADAGMQPCEVLQQREEEGRLVEAMNQLAPDYRAALVLREIEHFRYETISEVLGLPIGTVRSRLYRARVQMVALLKEE